MATVFVKLTFLLIVFELTTASANDCNLSNKKFKKMVKKYKQKCLNRGKTSSANSYNHVSRSKTRGILARNYIIIFIHITKIRNFRRKNTDGEAVESNSIYKYNTLRLNPTKSY